MRNKRNKTLISLMGASVLCPAGSLAAQTVDNTAKEQAVDSRYGLGEEIVVTARKREETLLDTPLAITAFGEKAIEEIGLEDVRDLSAMTPGFMFEPFQSVPGRYDSSPQFRGVGVNSSVPTRQTASIFVDGIYVANGVQGIALNDVSRVEIIKGPQSALFGRNTFGGAVNYVSKVPGIELAADVSLKVATRDDYSASVGIDIPLVRDVIRARISGQWSDKGGHYRNAVDGKMLGRERTRSVTGTLYFEPSAEFDATIRANYFENDDDAPAVSFLGKKFFNCGPFGGTNQTICGSMPQTQPEANTDIPAAILDLYKNNLYQVNNRPLDGLGLNRRSIRVSGQFNVRLPDTGVTISSLTGLNYDEVDVLRDGDDTKDNAFLTYGGRQFRDLSQELRISGQSFGDILTWSIGANYFSQRFTSNNEFIFIPGSTGFGTDYPLQEDIETFGYFGSAITKITDAITLTLEGRYQIDKVLEDGNILDNRPGAKARFTSFLPRAILDAQVTPDTLLYASYAEGNLPGGINSQVRILTPAQRAELAIIEPNAGENFAEESLKNYEIGLKHAFGRRGSIALSGFYMQRAGQSVRRADRVTDIGGPTPTKQVNYFINIGRQEIKGFELESNYMITPNITVGGTLGYVDSIVQDYETGTYAEVFGTPDASGTRSPRFPKWSGSVFVAGEGQLSSTLDWFSRADAFYTGRRFADEFNLATINSGWQINLRAGLKKDNMRLEAFVTNVTNADHPSGVNRFRDLSFDTPLLDFSTFGYQIGLRDKRQFGLRFSGNY